MYGLQRRFVRSQQERASNNAHAFLLELCSPRSQLGSDGGAPVRVFRTAPSAKMTPKAPAVRLQPLKVYPTLRKTVSLESALRMPWDPRGESDVRNLVFHPYEIFEIPPGS